jgi:hypothetical protein
MEEAAIDCKNVTTQKIATLPLSQKGGKEIRVKRLYFSERCRRFSKEAL